jgi:integrase
MGSVYRRKVKVCRTCGSPRIKACEAAGHDIEIKILPKWWIRYNKDGRSYFESSGSKLKTKAEEILTLRKAAVLKDEAIVTKKVLFEEAAKDIETEYTINGRKSLEDLQRRIKLHLMPYFKGKRLSHISTAVVNEYVLQRQAEPVVVRRARTIVHKDGREERIAEQTRTVSNAEINRELAILKRIFTLATRAKKVTQRPYIAMLREDNIRKGFFEPEQFASVLKHLPARMHPMVTFAHITGWRINEVLPIEWRQVDLKGGEVRLDPGTTKNGEARVFPMTVELRELLEQQKAARDKAQREHKSMVPWVFFRLKPKKGGKLEPAPIKNFDYKVWHAACRAAGCPGRIPHDLRRTAVRHFTRRGISEPVAMRLSGHKTRSVFDRYNIVSGDDLTDAARKLDGELPAKKASAV